MSGVLILRDHGEPASADAWSDAFSAVGFDPVVVPDLAGDAGVAAPVGGNYTRLDPIYQVAREVVEGQVLTDGVVSDMLLVGVGSSGWAALVLALAGQARGLVLVDGVGAPWLGAVDRGRRRRERLRAMAQDPTAMTPAPLVNVDPRLGHHGQPHGDREAVVHAAKAIAVPTLLIQTDETVAEDLAEAFVFGGGAATRARPPTPHGVAELVHGWDNPT